jgi:peptide/nickel transport system substrate-binding protein
MLEIRLDRRQLLRRLAVGGAAGVAAPSLGAILQACSGAGSAPATRGGTVSYALSTEPKVLNPPIHSLAVESTVMSLLFAGLVRMAPDGSFVPDLASKYAIEDGGLTYRFELRPGLRWQDGQPLTARDVQFTHQTYVAPSTRTAYVEGFDKVDRVETPSDTTVVYRMKEVFAPFLLDVAANAVLPQHVLAGSPDIRQDPFNRSPVGAGPFKLASWQTGSQLVLEANPNYWRGRPALDRFVLKVVPDATTQVNQLQAGEVDIVSVADPALWDRVKRMPGVATTTYDDTRYALVQLDGYVFLKDVAVRQALDYATPKQDIVTGVLRGLAVPAYTDVPPGSPYYNRGVEHHDYSLDRARRMLDQAGFTMQNGVMTKGGQPLEVPLYTVSNSPTLVQVAQVLKDSWSKIGVRTSVTTMEAATLFSDSGPQWNGKDGAVIYSWGQGVDPYNYINWSSKQITNGENDPGDNQARYASPVVDDLVLRGVRVADLAQRKKVYDQLQQILAHDVPVLFLYWPKALYAHSTKLHGFKPNAFSGVFTDNWTWTRS